MKNKSLIIIAIITVMVISAVIAVAALTSNKSMAAIYGTCTHDDDNYLIQQTTTGHTILCTNPDCPNFDTPVVVNEECTPSSEWRSNGESHYHPCTVCGKEFGIEQHTNGTHANGGICTICGLQYQYHGQGPSVVGYTDKTTTTHTPQYRCAWTGCFETVDGNPENHSGATHNNNGICTACNYQYQVHSQSTTAVACTDLTPTTHTPTYACTFEGCSGVFSATPEEHTGGTHANGGTCTVCEYVYQERTPGAEVVEYIDKTATTHTPTYACTFDGCTETIVGTPEEHTGGTHANGGTCTVCGQVYQEHTPGTEVVEYIDKTATTHTPTYACTFDGCTETITGNPEEHTGGTHANGGTCAVCEYIYQNHTKGTEVVEYIDKTATTHTPKYACACDGCTETFTEEPEEHTGGTHENGGVCTACEQQYQTHSQGTEIKEYVDITSTTHKPGYGCTFEGCTVVYPGTAEEHVYDKSSGNGQCTICSYNCTHPNITIKHDSTYHWDECDDCGAVFNATAHRYDANGECICGVTLSGNTEEPGDTPGETPDTPGETPEDPGEEPNENPGNTTNNTGNTINGSGNNTSNTGNTINNTGNTISNSGNTISNTGNTISNSGNTISNSGNTSNGTNNTEKTECKHEKTTQKSNSTYHWNECNNCGTTLNKTKHTFKDGKCSICGYVCTHSNTEWKSDSTEHWKVCKDCGTTISGTKEKHSYSGGKCTTCGASDGTVAVTTKLPNTGKTTIVMSSIAMIAVAGISFIGIKRYKGV